MNMKSKEYLFMILELKIYAGPKSLDNNTIVTIRFTYYILFSRDQNLPGRQGQEWDRVWYQ